MDNKKGFYFKIWTLMCSLLLINMAFWSEIIRSKSFLDVNECTTEKEINNIKYPDWNRTECYEFEWKYYYNLCSINGSCSDNAITSQNLNTTTIDYSWENPYSSKVNAATKTKLNSIVTALRSKIGITPNEELVSNIEKISKKLSSLKEKYKTNDGILNLISYLDYDLQKLKLELSNNLLTQWGSAEDSFFCDLLWNCDNTVNNTKETIYKSNSDILILPLNDEKNYIMKQSWAQYCLWGFDNQRCYSIKQNKVAFAFLPKNILSNPNDNSIWFLFEDAVWKWNYKQVAITSNPNDSFDNISCKSVAGSIPGISVYITWKISSDSPCFVNESDIYYLVVQTVESKINGATLSDWSSFTAASPKPWSKKNQTNSTNNNTTTNNLDPGKWFWSPDLNASPRVYVMDPWFYGSTIMPWCVNGQNSSLTDGISWWWTCRYNKVYVWTINGKRVEMSFTKWNIYSIRYTFDEEKIKLNTYYAEFRLRNTIGWNVWAQIKIAFSPIPWDMNPQSTKCIVENARTPAIWVSKDLCNLLVSQKTYYLNIQITDPREDVIDLSTGIVVQSSSKDFVENTLNTVQSTQTTSSVAKISQYPGCNAPDIVLSNWQIWSACNVWASVSWTWSESYWDIYKWWNNTPASSLNWLTLTSNPTWWSNWIWPCADGYKIWTKNDWEMTYNLLNKNYNELVNKLLIPKAGYWRSTPFSVWGVVTPDLYRYAANIFSYIWLTDKNLLTLNSSFSIGISAFDSGYSVRCIKSTSEEKKNSPSTQTTWSISTTNNSSSVKVYGSCNFTGTKELYYSNNWSTCIWAMFQCNNGVATWGTQFSPAPPTPLDWQTLYYSSDSCKNKFAWNALWTVTNQNTNSTSTSTPKSTTNNNNITTCEGSVWTWEWVEVCWENCWNEGFNKNRWEFAQAPTYACSWWCKQGYARPSLTANYCVKSDSPIYNGNDVKIDVSASKNCSEPWSSLSLTIWNAGPDIKLCQEFELSTPSRNGESYSCDSDSKFKSGKEAWPNNYSGWKWSSYTSLINNKYIVPWKYRIAVKSADGVVTYSNWYTIASSWDFSNPENCNYYAYPAKSVEDAVWYILSTKDVHFNYGIDWTQISKTCPQAQTEFIRLAHTTSWYLKYYQSPSIWWNGRVFWPFLSECYSKAIPKWTGPTYIWGFWTSEYGQENNAAAFDFQSWYTGWNAWALGWSACWNVPNHWVSQLYGWIKWESWKVFDCGKKTYGGVSASSLWTSATWTSTNNPTLICTLKDGTKIENGVGKELYYKNSNNTCISANFSCMNGDLTWANQFSPAPPRPAAWATLFINKTLCDGWDVTVSQTKNTLKEVGDSIKYTINWLWYDWQSCQVVHAHPNVPSAVNAARCDDVKNYVYLRDLQKWSYLDWVWTTTVQSNTAIYVAWVKVQWYFRNPNTGKLKSWNIIEVIK